PDGGAVLVSAGNDLRLWRLGNDDPAWTVTLADSVYKLTISDDGAFFMAIGSNASGPRMDDGTEGANVRYGAAAVFDATSVVAEDSSRNVLVLDLDGREQRRMPIDPSLEVFLLADSDRIVLRDTNENPPVLDFGVLSSGNLLWSVTVPESPRQCFL